MGTLQVFEMGIVSVLAFGFILIALEKVGWLDSFQALVLRDRLGVWGVGSAVIALWLWAIPVYCNYKFPLDISCSPFFEAERLPAVGAFLVLAAILLIVRAGNRR